MRYQPSEEDQRWWKELTALADADDVKGFYAHYARYLEWNGIYSLSRKAIYKMALLASK